MTKTASHLNKRGSSAGAFDGNAARDLHVRCPSTERSRTQRGSHRAQPERRHADAAQILRYTLFALAFALLGVLTVAVLLSHAMLTQIEAETADLEAQYDTLVEDSRLLQARFESEFRLDKLKEYAIGQLGMVRPAAEQTFVLPDHTQDSVTILDETMGQTSYAVQIKNFMTSLLEYLR